MNDSDKPPADDIYSKESPLPGARMSPRSSVPVSDSNPFGVKFGRDLVAPCFIAHLIFWPAFILCGSAFMSSRSLEFLWVPIAFSTLATTIGGALYGWNIGKRFTEMTYLNSSTDQENALKRGRRNRILMCLLQAILFPALFWGGCMMIVSLG